LIVAGNEQRFTTDTNKDAWYYGDGSDGAADMTGLLQGRSADMRYTPVGENFGDMQLTMTVAPFKTAGQAFSVAPLYMDVLIKFDAKTMTGYALRFIRTTKYHDAVDCMFVRYDHGKITPISEAVSTSALRPLCTISIQSKGNQLLAQATTSADPRLDNGAVLSSINISTTVPPNSFGGFGIQYNGGSPTMIRDMRVEWK
ncbi:MAG TPA: hypothetical protein VLA25_01045, partial [Methylotenera sp.]|nr:hypothetical protein [Methylotenera sp.]